MKTSFVALAAAALAARSVAADGVCTSLKVGDLLTAEVAGQVVTTTVTEELYKAMGCSSGRLLDEAAQRELVTSPFNVNVQGYLYTTGSNIGIPFQFTALNTAFGPAIQPLLVCFTQTPPCSIITLNLTLGASGDSPQDPWVEGYLGQRFYIEGPDAWYAVVSTPEVQLNLKMTQFDDEARQSFWTGAALQHFAADGSVTQSLLVDTVDHKKTEVSCSDIGAASPCIGNGGVTVTVNGVKQTKPAEFETAKGHKFAAANLPYGCKKMTKTYIAEHPEEGAHRMLIADDLMSFVVGRNLLDEEACAKWMGENQNIFGAEGEHSTILFSAPTMTTALEYYKYQEAGHQYYRIDLSTVDLQVGDVSIPQGILGETLRPRKDAEGKTLMSGQVLKADTDQYIVDGPFGRDFAAKHFAEEHTFHMHGNN